MIAHVVRAVMRAGTVDHVMVATDHVDIATAAERVGAEAVMTDSSIETGTDRVAAAVRITGVSADVIINVQGDEPLIEADSIDLAVRLLQAERSADIATLSAPLPASALLDSSKVKVVCGAPLASVKAASHIHRCAPALCFSRAPIGIDRDALSLLLRKRAADDDSSQVAINDSTSTHASRLHVGLYAFRPASLQRFVSLPPSPLEQLERLEQMRALENGMNIVVGEVSRSAVGVDTPEDLMVLEEYWQNRCIGQQSGNQGTIG